MQPQPVRSGPIRYNGIADRHRNEVIRVQMYVQMYIGSVAAVKPRW